MTAPRLERNMVRDDSDESAQHQAEDPAHRPLTPALPQQKAHIKFELGPVRH